MENAHNQSNKLTLLSEKLDNRKQTSDITLKRFDWLAEVKRKSNYENRCNGVDIHTVFVLKTRQPSTPSRVSLHNLCMLICSSVKYDKMNQIGLKICVSNKRNALTKTDQSIILHS